jgi:hypothetical protein
LTAPLILQIQQAAIDSNSSVTDVLRKAKVACTKLDLTEFGSWVDLELNGYAEKPADELPNYRKLRGFPQGDTPFVRHLPIIFQSAKMESICSLAYVGLSMPEIEETLRSTNHKGSFKFTYAPEQTALLRQWLNSQTGMFYIALSASQLGNIPNTVRNIILDWTMDMEKQGILGTDLMFNEQERAKSEAATQKTVNNIHIRNVGAFVQSAENSVIQGGANSVINLDGVHQLVKQVEELLPGADLPPSVKENTETALVELKEAANANSPDKRRLRKALVALKSVVAPAGEHLLRIAVDAAITKLTGSG